MHGQGVYKYCDGLPMPCYIEESLSQCCINLGRLGYRDIMTMKFQPLALVNDKNLWLRRSNCKSRIFCCDRC